jgi:hypothetical protein
LGLRPPDYAFGQLINQVIQFLSAFGYIRHGFSPLAFFFALSEDPANMVNLLGENPVSGYSFKNDEKLWA